jgi:2-aminoethylphosphonate-pyruvate transaminase
MRQVLMNPGPVVVDERVHEALRAPDLCHREPEFSELMASVGRKLTQVSGGDDRHAAVVFSGSGTAALEATLSSVVPQSGKLLVLDNGHYGERLTKIAAVHHIAHHVHSFGWAVPFDLAAIEEGLCRNPEITHIAMVHHETSTGMLNPLRQVGALAASHGKSLIVDAISSLGGELLNVEQDHVDWCVGTANKCLEGLPGLSFVCAPRHRLDELAGIPPRTFYLGLYQQYVASDRVKAPPFTPAIQIFQAFDVALDLMLAEGVSARHARYEALATQLRSGLADLGFRFYLPAEHRSATLTAVYLPSAMTYPELHDALKAHGFVIYAAQENLAKKVFRLANMGQITAADLVRFLEVLSQMIPSPACNQAGAE